MQLLIAAPGTSAQRKARPTSWYVRSSKDHEHVHVVGLRGFAQNKPASPVQELIEEAEQ
ncbi:hypothetical protein OH492_07725 [Vibrio chagasii]|nr:hypothetical protein [Vibrio chagasii]